MVKDVMLFNVVYKQINKVLTYVTFFTLLKREKALEQYNTQEM